MSQARVVELVTWAHSGQITLGETIRTVKREYILVVLGKYGFNICQAAEAMEMHRNTLSRVVDELGINLNQLRREYRSRKKAVRSAVASQVTTRTA